MMDVCANCGLLISTVNVPQAAAGAALAATHARMRVWQGSFTPMHVLLRLPNLRPHPCPPLLAMQT